MAINPFVNVRSIINLLQKVLPGRKDIDKHMINNVRIHTRRKNLDLDSNSIKIDPKYFEPTVIESYGDADDNYTQGEYQLFCIL